MAHTNVGRRYFLRERSTFLSTRLDFCFRCFVSVILFVLCTSGATVLGQECPLECQTGKFTSEIPCNLFLSKDGLCGDGEEHLKGLDCTQCGVPPPPPPLPLDTNSLSMHNIEELSLEEAPPPPPPPPPLSQSPPHSIENMDVAVTNSSQESGSAKDSLYKTTEGQEELEIPPPPPPPLTMNYSLPTHHNNMNVSSSQQKLHDQTAATQSVFTIEEILSCSVIMTQIEGQANNLKEERKLRRCREARYEYLINNQALALLRQQQRLTLAQEESARNALRLADKMAKQADTSAVESSAALYANVDLSVNTDATRENVHAVNIHNLTNESIVIGETKKMVLSSIPRVSRIHYQSFFFDFELSIHPVVVAKATLGAGDTGAAHLMELDVECMEKITALTFAPGEMRSVQDICTSIFDQEEPSIMLPGLLANDLLQRLSASFGSRQQWPSVTRGSSRPTARNVGLHEGCPFGLHQLIFVKHGRVRVVAFPENQTARIYPQLIKTTKIRSHTINRPHFPWKFDEDLDVLSDDGPNITKFPLLGGVRGYESTISKGEMLFIPGGYHLSWRYLAPTMMLRHCYLDASNLQLVKTRLELEGLVDAHKGQLWRTITDTHFDASMRKLPLSTITVPLAWNSYRNPTSQDAQTFINTESNERSNRGINAQFRYNKYNFGNHRFQKWQMDRLWHRTIHGLTRSQPPAPTVVNVGRSNVTLRWQQSVNRASVEADRAGVVRDSTFASKDSGATDASWLQGYAITATPVTLDMLLNHGGENNVNSASVVTVDVASDATFSNPISSSSGIVTSVFTFEDAARTRLNGGAEVLTSSDMVYATIRDLRPGSIYVFTVAALAGELGQFTSSATVPVKTLGSTTPGPPSRPLLSPATTAGTLAIEWGALADEQSRWLDDGGATIVGFTIQYRAYNAGAQWTSVSTGASTRYRILNNLVPGLTYVARIAAKNTHGLGAFSPVSIAAVVPSLKEKKRSSSASHGNTHHHDLSPQQSISGSAETDIPCFGPLIAFDDRRETLTVSIDGKSLVEMNNDAGNLNTFDTLVWASHYSPRTFKLQNVELIAALPLDASVPLENAAYTAGRVVIVERGAVPLRQKVQNAQYAGAIGVLIVDTTHNCDEHFDQNCCPGGNKANGEGFAAQDRSELWEAIKIPSAIMRHNDGHVLLSMLGIEGTS